MYRITVNTPMSIPYLSTMPDDNDELWKELQKAKFIDLGEDTAVVKSIEIEDEKGLMTLNCTVTRELEDEKLRKWIGDIMTNVPVIITVNKDKVSKR
jgi:hypothetical protein